MNRAVRAVTRWSGHPRLLSFAARVHAPNDPIEARARMIRELGIVEHRPVAVFQAKRAPQVVDGAARWPEVMG